MSKLAWIGRTIARSAPHGIRRGFAEETAIREPQLFLETLGPRLNRDPSLDTVAFDLPPSKTLEFEDLAGLFSSTPFDYSTIVLTVREAAYLFGVVRRMQAKRIVEIGRYKGGSTFLMAAAMGPGGTLWSIDIGEKEGRLHKQGRSFDTQLADALRRFDLRAELIVGDSRTVQVQTGEVDLVFIDGDHSYEGARNDFERFGRRVRIGGAVLFDDAFKPQHFGTHSDTVGRLVEEVVAEGEFRLVKGVNQLAHLERIKPAATRGMS